MWALLLAAHRRLNEGWTVYLERRIMARLYGEQASPSASALSRSPAPLNAASMPPLAAPGHPSRQLGLLTPATGPSCCPPAAALRVQAYQFRASLGLLTLQKAVNSPPLGPEHPFTRLVPDLSGGPPPQLGSLPRATRRMARQQAGPAPVAQ